MLESRAEKPTLTSPKNKQLQKINQNFLGDEGSSLPHSFLIRGGHFKEREDEPLSHPLGQPGLGFLE